MPFKFVSWIKPLGHYVYRFGKRFFMRPKRSTKCRQFHYRNTRFLRRLRFEPLGERVMLTAYYLAPGVSSPTIDTTSEIWLANNAGPLTYLEWAVKTAR